MTMTLSQTDVRVLEELWAVPQPSPASPLRYHLCVNPNGPSRSEHGFLSDFEQLRQMMLARTTEAFIVVSPADHDGWFAQLWLEPDGWLVELGLAAGAGNEVYSYRNSTGAGRFSLASAYAMMCQLCRNQRLDLPTDFTLLTF